MSEEQNTYACSECGFHYRDEETMKTCEAWCKEHGSCNSEITKLSVERSGQGSDPVRGQTPVSPVERMGTVPEGGLSPGSGCEDGVCRLPQTKESLEKKVEEATNQYLRALADYQNLQKEVARQREEMGGYAILRVVERFLPMIDHLQTAMIHKPSTVNGQLSTVDQWVAGIGHIQTQFDAALNDLGIKKIATLGQKFDATKHEAVGEESAEGTAAEGTVPEGGLSPVPPVPGTILREVQAGYEINGKVVRPARVITSK